MSKTSYDFEPPQEGIGNAVKYCGLQRGGIPKGEDCINGHLCFQVPEFPVLEMLLPGALVISSKGELTFRQVFSF